MMKDTLTISKLATLATIVAELETNNLNIAPRELRKLDPTQLSLAEATRLAVHCWLCAPVGWKTAVLKRLEELRRA